MDLVLAAQRTQTSSDQWNEESPGPKPVDGNNLVKQYVLYLF